MIVVTLGCGSDHADASGGAKLDEVCGDAEPFRVLEVDADAEAIVGWSARFVDGWRILGVRFEGVGDEDGRRELWSVGPCGEDPVLLLEGVSSTSVYEDVWPDILVADGMVVHPRGLREPNVVFAESIDARPTPHGRLGMREDAAGDFSIVLQPWPADPWTEAAETVVLVEHVRFPDDVAWGSGDDAYAISLDDELVHVSLPDRSVEILASSVEDFRVGYELPYISWQHLPSVDEPDAKTGQVVAWNRESEESIDITAQGWSPGVLMHVAPGHDVILLTVGPDGATTRVIYDLPSLENREVEGSTGVVMRTIGDGRVLVQEHWAYGPFSMLDATTGSVTPFLDAVGPAWSSDEAVYVPDGLRYLPAEEASKYGVLKRARYADGQADVLAARVTADWVRLEDDQIATPVDVDGDDVGDLVAVEPETLDELPIDSHTLGLERDDAEANTVMYAVADGERAGIWVAKLATE